MRERVEGLVGKVRAASVRFLNQSDERFIPEVLRQDGEAYRKARLAVRIGLSLVVASLCYALLSLINGNVIAGIAIFLTGGVFAAALHLLQTKARIDLTGHVLALAMCVTVSIVLVTTGGTQATITTWYAAIPIVTTLLIGRRAGGLWTLISALCIATVFLLESTGVSFAPPPRRAAAAWVSPWRDAPWRGDSGSRSTSTLATTWPRCPPTSRCSRNRGAGSSRRCRRETRTRSPP